MRKKLKKENDQKNIVDLR